MHSFCQVYTMVLLGLKWGCSLPITAEVVHTAIGLPRGNEKVPELDYHMMSMEATLGMYYFLLSFFIFDFGISCGKP